MLNKLYNSKPVLASYLRLIIGCTLSLILSFIFLLVSDIHTFNITTFILSTGIFGFIPIYLLRNNIQIIEHEKARTFIYIVLIIGIGFGNLFFMNFAHSLRAGTIEVESVTDALNSDEEFFHVSKYTPIDKRYKGVYNTYKITERRNGSDIKFLAYVVHPFEGVKGAYIGYRLDSPQRSCTFASDEELNDYQNEFISTLDDKVNNFEYSTNELYLKCIIPSDDDYTDYCDAQQFCDDTINYSAQKIKIFTVSDTKNETKSQKAVITYLAIVFFAVYPIIGLFFWFCNTSKKLQQKAKKQNKEEWNTLMCYIKEKNNWYIIAIFAILIGYFIIVILCGYNSEHTSTISMQLIYYGAANKIQCFEQGEIWRFVTYGIMHRDYMHLAENIFALVFFVIVSSISLIKPQKIFLVFGVTTILSGIFTIAIYEPYTVLVGASGGIMGMFGYGVGYSQIIAKNYKTKSKKINGNVFSNIIYNPYIYVIIPTIFFSFMPHVSMAGHLSGLAFGIVIGILDGLHSRKQ